MLGMGASGKVVTRDTKEEVVFFHLEWVCLPVASVAVQMPGKCAGSWPEDGPAG